jgi:hypothetical protein
MRDPQPYTDRLLEVENLTDALQDEDADYLINWGVAQLKEHIGAIEDDESAGEYLNNLMGFMRTMNQITGNLGNIRQDELIKLKERHQTVFGPGRELTTSDVREVAASLVEMAPHQAIDFLLQWLLPDQRPPTGDGPQLVDPFVK